MTKKILEKNYKAVVFLIICFIAIVSFLNAANDSAIYDEIAHIPAGYSYLTQGDMRLNPEHPPMLKNFSAIPLMFMDLNFDTSADFWNEDNVADAQWNAGRSFLYESGNNPDSILFWARIPMVIIALIFGLFIFKWGKEMAGTLAGLFALTLYAFDPNILGHNHFVTTDLGIAAFLTFSFYYFLKFIKNPSWKNVFLCGLFLGLLQLAKFSSVLAFPIFALILIIYPFVREAKNGTNSLRNKFLELGKYVGKFSIAFIISLVIVWIVYAVNISGMPKEKIDEGVNYYFTLGEPNNLAITTQNALLKMNSIDILRPLAEYSFGVARVFQRVAGGNQTYFLGEVSSEGFFSYFPVIFLIKEPLPVLLLLSFVLGVAVRKILNLRNITSRIRQYLRFHIVDFLMISFIVLYLVTSVTSGLNIGFRHLFPIMPFIYILISKSIIQLTKSVQKRKLLIKGVISLLIFWFILETVLVYPFYMSYFNQLAGGPKNGYKYATDSNADWGQDLKRFSIFLNEHPEIKKIRVDYFGITDLDYYLGDKYEPWWRDRRPIDPGWYAISVLFLQESIYDKKSKDEESYRWLINKKPAYQVGTSIFIYNITEGDALGVN